MLGMANILQIAKSTWSSGLSFLYWLSSFGSSFSTCWKRSKWQRKNLKEK